MTVYRLWYGNGQVSGYLETLKEAERAERDQRAYDRAIHQPSYDLHIEEYIGDGEWRRVRKAQVVKRRRK